MSKCDECKMTRLCDELARINKVPKHENCRCFTPTKPQTNADRIRAMTDEELADWIINDLIEPGYYTYKEGYELWLKWLKKGSRDE